MKSSQRLSEKWYRRGLWLISVIFAGFLIGLGSSIVQDLPKVESNFGSKIGYNQPRQSPKEIELQSKIAELQKDQRENSDKMEQHQLQLQVAQTNNRVAKESFQNWITTRQATQRPDEDHDLLAKTKELDQLRGVQRKVETQIEDLKKIQMDNSQLTNELSNSLSQESAKENTVREKDRKAQELRVFLSRLMITLPLLALAGWLLVKKRKSAQWPFVWGFVFFAFFTFFVELVPYLPSYGGYFRSVVGIVATLLLGRYGIRALNEYMERQKLTETKSGDERRSGIGYEEAQKTLAKGACPGCERPLDLKDGKLDFCPHCGLGIHDHCTKCSTRKSAFNQFCHACGTNSAHSAKAEPLMPSAEV